MGFLLAVELVFVGALFGLLNQAEAEALREEHAKEIVGYTNRLVQVIWTSGQCFERYLRERDPIYESKYLQAEHEIRSTARWLRENIKDNPEDLKDLDVIEQNITKALAMYGEVRDQSKNMSTIEVIQLIRARKVEFQPNFDVLAKTVLHLLESQRRIQLESPTRQRQSRQDFKVVLYAGLAGNVLVGLLFAGFFVRGITSRLDVLVENTERMRTGRELVPALKGADEIAQLDNVFHSMADAIRTEEEMLKASEERVRAIIEKMPVGLVMIERSGTIEYVNPMLERISGFELEELVGKKINKLFARDEHEKPAEFLEEIRTRSVGRIHELTALKKDGEKYPVEFSLTDFQAVEGPRQLAIVLDVTERYEIQKMRQAFVSMVSHELRTPLTAVSGYLALLGMGAFGEISKEATDQAERAEVNIQRLIKLINDLLDLEKMESGTLKIELSSCRLEAIIGSTEDAVKVFAADRGVKLEVPDVKLEFIADRDRIIQVLVNLVSNAVKFSPPGASVTIEAEPRDEYVEVRVVDRGRGIPARYREVIFERFQQVEASDAKQKGGTGLGLAICKSIVEQHGGSIGVDSEEGKGSTFWLRLPLAPQAALETSRTR